MRRLWTIGFLIAACAPPPPETIPRVVEGEVEPGPFVPPYAYHWFIRGEADATQRAYEAAAIELEAARTASPDDVFLLTRLALAYEYAGQRRQADQTLEDARELAPASAQVLLTQGKIDAAREDFEAALLAFRRAWSIRPSSPEAPIALARLLESMGQRLRAKAVLQEHLERARDLSDAHRLFVELALEDDDFDAVLTITEKSANHSKARALATLALERGRPLAATRLLAMRSSDEQDAQRLVEAMLRSGQRDKARALLVQWPAERFGDRIDRARLYLDVGRPDLAQRLAQEAPDHPHARYLLGASLLAQRRHAEAARFFASVPRGSSDHIEAMKGLVDCLTAFDHEGLALELIQSMHDNDVTLRVASANLYDALGAYATAVSVLASEGAAEQLARASLLERLGRRREAHAHYRRIEPHHLRDESARRRVRAERAVGHGRLDEAIDELWKIRRLAPQDLWARARLVELLERSGRQAVAARERSALVMIAHEEELLRWLAQ